MEFRCWLYHNTNRWNIRPYRIIWFRMYNDQYKPMFHEDGQQPTNGNLLNEDELHQMQVVSSPDRKKQKLKNWVIYCKRRGKSRANNQQQPTEEKDKDRQYSKDLEEVGSFSSVREFFGYYTSIRQPSSLEIDTKIFYFLKDCKPLWQEWLHSGCLLITIKFKDEEKDTIGARILNSTWQFLLFGLIGNNLPTRRDTKEQKQDQPGKQLIIGIILQRRQKISLIEVWYRNQLHASQLTRLLEQDINEHLKLHTKEQKNAIHMKYKRHKDSIETNSTLKGGINFKMATIGTVSMGW